MIDLHDKTFLITGASRGLGRALADAAATAGARVVLTARAEAPLRAAVEDLQARGHIAFALPADVAVCAAAVSDYRPAERSLEKLKRGSLGTIELVENPDIAAEVGRLRGEKPLVVFALETKDGLTVWEDHDELRGCLLCVGVDVEA